MSTLLEHKRSWVEIHLSRMVQNYRTYLTMVNAQNTKIIAVVKANAYGHGAVEVARSMRDEGVDSFAVSNIDEAIELRLAGIEGDILILGYTPAPAMNELKRYDITQTIFSPEYAEMFCENAPENVKCQFAINTGMNRIGLNSDNLDECEKVIRYYAKRLRVVGIFTHLSVTDSQDESDMAFTQRQIESFEALAERIEDLNLEVIHCMNSAGGLNASSKYGNTVRLGILLYGLQPSNDIRLPSEISPILEWKSVVSMVETVREGEPIGYGRSYYAPRQMRVATIPTGYADGYSRSLSNKGYVLISGKKAPIVGKVCMDQMMVDVSDIPNVRLNDEVILIGKSGKEEITADMIASMIETIGYEIVCNISSRVERVYL